LSDYQLVKSLTYLYLKYSSLDHILDRKTDSDTQVKQASRQSEGEAV
jgi:hypothetical protein